MTLIQMASCSHYSHTALNTREILLENVVTSNEISCHACHSAQQVRATTLSTCYYDTQYKAMVSRLPYMKNGVYGAHP